MTNKNSSRHWLREHFTDPYVKKAHKEGFRSRAVYKLQELQQRDKLFKPGMTIIDLGAAPGGWCQYVSKLIGMKGQLIAVDLLPMEPIVGVDFIQGDFSEEGIVTQIIDKLFLKKAHWVLSDMAPNMSGNESVDIPRSRYLNEISLDFSKEFLFPAGGFLTKVFQGEGFDDLLFEMKRTFKKVSIRKPKASRGKSREVYIVAKELKYVLSNKEE